MTDATTCTTIQRPNTCFAASRASIAYSVSAIASTSGVIWALPARRLLRPRSHLRREFRLGFQERVERPVQAILLR
ncbi:MAG: hypothetical protein HYX38_37660 [Rhodospirillales bacterium]|nr:hypothetical protein [Rhodospirillales bacterium]